MKETKRNSREREREREEVIICYEKCSVNVSINNIKI